MKKISLKQQQKNKILQVIKNELLEEGKYCRICHKNHSVLQLMHILPKSIYPEYYTERWNLTLGCPVCHSKFDDDISFRRKQNKLLNQILEKDEVSAKKYFRV